ncbi:MAG: hypothetical protein AAFP90_17090 [Planctomycetota bacterium]
MKLHIHDARDELNRCCSDWMMNHGSLALEYPWCVGLIDRRAIAG